MFQNATCFDTTMRCVTGNVLFNLFCLTIAPSIANVANNICHQYKDNFIIMTLYFG